MDIQSIEYKLNTLPDELKEEVLDFIDFLISKNKHKTVATPFDFSWEGGLSDSKEEYSSVELQHRATDWR